MMYNIRIGIIQWQIPDFPSDGNSNVRIFRRLRLKIPLETFALENLGQGHEVQHSQWSNSMSNMND